MDEPKVLDNPKQRLARFSNVVNIYQPNTRRKGGMNHEGGTANPSEAR